MAKPELNVDFNPDLFNNVYWHLLKAFENHAIRYIWLYGGSSASKTYSVVQLVIILMLTNRDENTLILRKFAVDIKDSIFADFKTIITEWGLSDYFIIQTNYIYCKVTGSYVRFRGLDDSEKVKGISGFKRVIMEEVSQFDEVDFKQIKKRLRGKPGQQIIGIFNPISEEHWIKINVFDKEILQEVESDISEMYVNEQGNLVIMKTNYLDNRYIVGPNFVDQHVIDDFEKDKVDDNAYYQVYGLGNWGKLRTGGEFWKDFNANKHLTKIGWNEDISIHLTFDENVNPFLTCLVWQLYGVDNDIVHHGEPLKGKKVAVQIDEICLPDPRNRRHYICNEFIARYPLLRVAGSFIYGDRTSLKEDTAKEKGENFFTDISKYLRDYRPTQRLQNVNPSVVQSGGFINACYRGTTDVVILINEKCKKSINDYQYALEDSDGTLKKTKKTNPVTKVQYEEYGHPSDAKRYLLTVAYADDYNTYIRGGKGQLPRLGKPVSRAGY
jgi:hypothetical protein